jgi:hypothetical protein
MKTDYQNINAFEASVVAMIVLGFVVLGMVVFSGLAPRQQKNVASAFDLFDFHEAAAQSIDSVQFLMGVPEEFYNQFYIAFEQVAALPPETLTAPREVAQRLYDSIGNFSDQIAEAKQLDKPEVYAFVHYKGPGVVLGASVVATTSTCHSDQSQPLAKTETLKIPYTYESPDLSKLNFSWIKY